MNTSNLLFGVGGVIVGSVAAFFITKHTLKEKYEKQADEEVESVKQVYKKHYEAVMGEVKVDEELKTSEKISNNEVTTKPVNKVDYSEPYRDSTSIYKSTSPESLSERPSTSVKTKIKPKKIVILTPEEFFDSKNEAQTLYYYKDGILCDDNNNIIKDTTSIVGEEALNDFGKYEEDTVYVHNDTTGLDYEIILEHFTYREAAPKGVGS